MSRETFAVEFARLMASSYKIPSLTPDTDISCLDSLGVTETCVLLEEHLSMEIGYDEVRALKTYGELTELINRKAAT